MSTITNAGIHHLGLATHDMEATLTFYRDVLGFEMRVADVIQPQAGGQIRHALLDAGSGEMVAFMECNDVQGIAADFDTGINRGLGIAGGVMHFAFKSETEEALKARREDLLAKDVEVTDVVDHGWCKSIYFKDPNGLQLEFCTTTAAEFGAEHLVDADSDTWTALARPS